ncbi:MAG: GNAT family N-acetyltransferase [Planctomycetota bacterium]
MQSRWKQSIALGMFRVAKGCLRILPSHVLRFRPFAVFEVAIGEHANAAAARVHQVVDESVELRWIADRGEFEESGSLVDPRNIRNWDDNSRRAAVVRQNGQVVGVAWVATGSYTEAELGLAYHLEPDEVWLFASVVDPRYRRRGLYTALLSFVIAELQAARCKRLLLGVSTGNQASLRSHLGVGAKRLGSIFVGKSLGIVCCTTHGKVGRLSPSAIAWRRPIVVSIGR